MERRTPRVSSIYIAIILSMLLLILVLVRTEHTQAHSGRTDSYGGHNCYVGSCAGTYHYHNDGYSSYDEPVYDEPDYTYEGQVNGENQADEDTQTTVDIATSNGKKEGYSDGFENNLESPDPDPSSACDGTFTFDGYAPDEYQDAFYDAYQSACHDNYNDAFDAAYSVGYKEGQSDYETELAASKSADEDSSATDDGDSGNGWGWALGLGALYGGISGYGYISDKYKEHKHNKQS